LNFFDAAKFVKNLYPDTRFVLSGGLDTNSGSVVLSELQVWSKDGLWDSPVHVKVKPWLAETSVFVLPSYYREGVPWSMQEATAVLRAIITTDMLGCRETVINVINGFLIPAREANALAQTMLKFIINPSLIESMERENLRMAEKCFNVNKINTHMLEILGVESSRIYY
jgi:glycosyltransferase involved in cell wall biosynthesis